MSDLGPIITQTNKQSDAAQIIYGLELRGVRAVAHYAPDKVGGYLIAFDSPTPSQIHQKIALDSIESIWDAILDEYPRATTTSGHCYFCHYDVNGLPRPTVCPECGRALDTIEARRAMRDGRKT